MRLFQKPRPPKDMAFKPQEAKTSRLYRWIAALANHKQAPAALFISAFLESSILAIPPDTLLVPMVIEKPRRFLFFAFICTAGSLFGAAAAYVIGAFFFYSIAQPILNFYHLMDRFILFQKWYHDHGVLIILFAGVTPFPFKLVTIASGLTQTPFLAFMLFCCIARSIRFYTVSVLSRCFQRQLLAFLSRRLGLLFFVGTVVFFLVLLYLYFCA